ncbi:MAG: hypothetical protein AAF570_17165, partial [Bacteroidota bacterium]
LGVGVFGTIEKVGTDRLLIAGDDGVCLTDTLGDTLWTFRVSGSRPSAILNSDGDIIYCSRIERGSAGEGLQMLKLDTLGNLNVSYFEGTVYWDINQDCNFDTTETPFHNWIVEANPGAFTTLTDSAGFYSLQIDTGSYTVEIHPNSPYWRAQCPGSQQHSASVPLPLDTVSGLDFAIYDSITCPDLFVDISTPLVRPCSTSTYTITYSNQGSGTALDPTVELTVDTLLTVLASGIPWELPQSGNIYRFKVGTLAVGDTGSFQLLAVPDCDTNIIGRTICNRAHITPDSICTTPDPNWDGASIEVEGTCLGDTVQFTIRNIGQNNMSPGGGGLVVLEDDIMHITGSFDLNAGQDTLIKIPANGRTYALMAAQRPGHPGNSNPRAFVEACSTNAQGGWSLGHITTQPQDDGDHFIGIDCQEVIASYDPNDKRVFPGGTGQDHRVMAHDELTYHIRFQNIGTDTAFRVVIVDTLPPEVDPASLIPGAFSHPYTLTMPAPQVLRFTFEPIALVDSATNEAASMGFVKFRVRQQPGNGVGTRIDNMARIYFDFNSPVKTDTAWVTVGDQPWWDVLADVPEAGLVPQPQLEVGPNPFQSHVDFWLGEGMKGKLERLEVFDLTGKMVHSQAPRPLDYLQM